MQTAEFAQILLDILDEYRILDESPLMKITDVRRESGERLLITFANGEVFSVLLQRGDVDFHLTTQLGGF